MRHDGSGRGIVENGNGAPGAHRRRTVLFGLWVIFSLVCAVPGRGIARDAVQGLETLDFRRVIREAKGEVFPAVVFIKCVSETHERGEKGQRETVGSGVIISPAGHVLTNWHVTENAVDIRCQLYDGQHFNARLLGADKDVDLAVLQLDRPDDAPALPYAQLGESDGLEEGDFVMAMGAPWGMSRSVSIGIISCSNRYLPEHSKYSLWLQTDASISPGNSGGPLINTDGEVVGITTLGILYGGNIGFAVPSDTIRQLLPQLREHGEVKWSWTGLQLQPIRDFRRDTYFEGTDGVVVADIEPHSPAQVAGLQPRDRLLALNGEPLSALYEEKLPQVRRTLGLLLKDSPAELSVRRDGKVLDIHIVPRAKGEVEGEELDCPRWDLTLKAINRYADPELHFYREEGVYIYGLKQPGNGASAGLARRDILMRIGDREISSLQDVQRAYEEAIENLEERTRVVVHVLRNGRPRQFVLSYARDYSRD